MSRVVIVGASVGGVKSAQALRNEGFEGELIIVETENIDRPYDKPPLSKGYLSNGQSIEAISLLDERSFHELDAQWRFGVAASGVDVQAKQLRLEDGSSIPYDTLIIATGARARRSPWGEGPSIHVLRTAKDAERLRKDMVPGNHLVIVGGGFIGAEAAATAKRAGLKVSIVDPLQTPMSRVLNAEVGELFLHKHESEGIDMYFNTGVDRVENTVADDKPMDVVLSNGTVLNADAVLVGIGAQVNTEWLEDSDLMLDNGILCDATLQAKNTENIYVLGDVCRWEHGSGSTRLEHWTNATEQALVVAHNVFNPRDDARRYEPKEYVWSDQFDWKIQVVGHTGTEDFHVVGDTTAGRFAVIYSEDGDSATGAVVVNWPRALVRSRQAVMEGSSKTALVENLRQMAANLALAGVSE